MQRSIQVPARRCQTPRALVKPLSSRCDGAGHGPGMVQIGAATPHAGKGSEGDDARSTMGNGPREQPFAHREDIESVAQLFGLEQGRRTVESPKALRGARVAFRPVPGLSQERLQRILDCHLARNAVLGHDVPEMDYCPLVPKDVTAQVLSGGDRYLVDVQSTNPASAQEIWTRAQKIGAPQTEPAVKP